MMKKIIELEGFKVEVPFDAKNFRLIKTSEFVRIYFHTKFNEEKYLPTYKEIKDESNT